MSRHHRHPRSLWREQRLLRHGDEPVRPNRIVVSHQSSVVPTVRDAHDLFQCAVDALDPTQSYCVSAHWHGRIKPPRGFKADYDRGEFIRKLNRAADAVAQAA